MTLYLIFSLDIDECEMETDNCDQTCTNTDGSFACSCLDGFKLSTDHRSCSGKEHNSYGYNVIHTVTRHFLSIHR